MSTLSFGCLFTLLSSTSVFLFNRQNVRFILFRREFISFSVILVLIYFYIHSLLEYLLPRIKGLNLEKHSLRNHLKFAPPELIDRGFNDLKIYDHFWKMIHKRFSYCASQGFRSYMEDRMHYMYDPNRNLSIFSIFDGHGGMYVSDYLETHFACSIRDRLVKIGARRKLSTDSVLAGRDPTYEAVTTEVLRLDDAISSLDQKYTSMTGSTCIAAILEQNRFLTVVNVGDSRAVACDERNRALALSKDHKPDDPDELRRIELWGGFVSKDDGTPRVQGILAVSRSFGDTLLKRLGVLTARPDVEIIDLAKRKLRFLIVGTDGFWDVVTNQEAVKFANDYLRSHGSRDWHRISSYLVRIALDRQTHDNVSVLFLKLK